MSDETLVAVYDTVTHAEAALAALKAAGVPADAIGMHAGPGTGAAGTGTGTGATATVAAPAREQGFWAGLFGGEPDHDTAVYDRSLQGGSTVVSVKTPQAHVARVLDILESQNPIDIDERAASYGLATTTRQPLATPVMPVAPASTARTGAVDETLQLAEERLTVGKRVVNRGGVRVRRYVVETPVEENVSLHSERVVVERHPVTDNRPVGSDDFSDRTIEMTESAEEAVVSKTARVVEEIGLRKEATDRVETVRDTVRKEEAEVVQVPATETTAKVTPVTKTGGAARTTLPPKR